MCVISRCFENHEVKSIHYNYIELKAEVSSADTSKVWQVKPNLFAYLVTAGGGSSGSEDPSIDTQAGWCNGSGPGTQTDGWMDGWTDEQSQRTGAAYTQQEGETTVRAAQGVTHRDLVK